MIRDSLDLCPSNKLLWSTDGHWYPETYLLAVLQMREGLSTVLCEYVRRGALTSMQTIQIVTDLLFTTANKLYGLGLELHTPGAGESNTLINRSLSRRGPVNDFDTFDHFLLSHRDIRFLRLQWLDYTATARLKLLPIKRAKEMFQQSKYLGATTAVFGLTQMDIVCEGFKATGEYNQMPVLSSLRPSARSKYATVQCEFRKGDGSEVDLCPRTILRRQVEEGTSMGYGFLVGFELEVVFMRKDADGEYLPYVSAGHCWAGVNAMQDSRTLELLEHIIEGLERAGIEFEQFHPETAPGQVSTMMFMS